MDPFFRRPDGRYLMSSFSCLCFQGVKADKAAQHTRFVLRYVIPSGPGELCLAGVLFG